MHPSASFSATIRVRIENHPGAFARLAAGVGEAGGLLGAIDLVRVERTTKIRDVNVLAGNEAHLDAIVETVRAVHGVDVVHVSDRTFLAHLGGKIEIRPRFPVKTREDLSMAYTPGVARVSRAIADDPEKVWNLTIKRNTVAVVSDGTSVLGLGDVGPEAALPVMEGKAVLFKEFGDVDAFPVCLDTKDPDEIVRTVEAIAPGFGGINLEDISAPRCFEIERRLRESLDIPVFHDDQHGTAIVVLASLLNALRVVGKRIEDVRIVTTGCGAAGMASHGRFSAQAPRGSSAATRAARCIAGGPI
jgi:malate dehydrogenase (oxaloacetate-decarboxylating)